MDTYRPSTIGGITVTLLIGIDVDTRVVIDSGIVVVVVGLGVSVLGLGIAGRPGGIAADRGRGIAADRGRGIAEDGGRGIGVDRGSSRGRSLVGKSDGSKSENDEDLKK